MLQILRQLTIPNLDEQVRRMTVTCDRTGSGRYQITVETDEASIAMTLECLRLLMGVSRRMYTAMDRADTRQKGEAQAAQLHDRQRAIAAHYWECRAKGLKHRRAIAATVEYCPEANAMQFNKADVNACVKAYPKQSLRMEVSHATERETDQSRIA